MHICIIFLTIHKDCRSLNHFLHKSYGCNKEKLFVVCHYDSNSINNFISTESLALQIYAPETAGFSFPLCISLKHRLIRLHRIIVLKGKKNVVGVLISKIPEKGEKWDYFNSFFILVLLVSFMEIKSRLSQTSCFFCNILSFFLSMDCKVDLAPCSLATSRSCYPKGI